MPSSYDFIKSNDVSSNWMESNCFLAGAKNFKVMEIEVFKLLWDLMINENILE